MWEILITILIQGKGGKFEKVEKTELQLQIRRRAERGAGKRGGAKRPDDRNFNCTLGAERSEAPASEGARSAPEAR